MKKLIAVMAFAGVLSVPSVIFADANWYGSLRGGVEFGEGDALFYDGASRWGIKGSNEVSEGLSAVYRFEAGINNSADQAGNGRLNYVGLSGGFGTLSLGQIWSASYNHAGVIRDIGSWLSSSDTSGRVGNAVSYAFSSDAASFQVDAIMDGSKDTSSAIDQVEFGVTVNLGDIGKIALSYTDVNDATMDKMVTGTTGFDAKLTADSDGMLDKSGLDVRDKTSAKPINGTIVSVAHTINKEAVVLQQVYTSRALIANEMGSAGYKMAGGKLYASSCLTDAGVPKTGNDECKEKTWAYVQTMNKAADEGKVTTTHNIFVANSGNLLMAENTPGTPAISGSPAVPAETEDRVRMVTVIKGDSANPQSFSDVSHFVTTTAAELGAHHGDDVSVYNDAGGDPVVYRHIGPMPQAGGAAPISYYDAATGAEVTVAANRADAVSNSNDYYLDEGVLTSLGASANLDEPTTLVMDTVVTAAAVPAGDATPAVPATPHLVTHTVTMNTKDVDYGSTKTGVSAQLDLGALTLGLGYSKTESNDPMDKMDAKTTYLGASGSIGDTGMGWRAWARNNEGHDGMESTPWGMGLDKALGGGANAYIEHANADDGASGTTVMGLVVNF